MASAFTCDETTKENKRINEEKALYHILKEYLNVINCAATHEQARLDIVASGFELNLDDFVFVVYVSKRWRNFVVDGLSKYVEEKYHENVQTNQSKTCTWIWTEIIPSNLHCYPYYIHSPHTSLHPMIMFHHHRVDIFS